MENNAEGDLKSQLQDYGLKSEPKFFDEIQSKVCTILIYKIFHQSIDCWSFLSKTHFLDSFEIFSLGMGQIRSMFSRKHLQHDSMPLLSLKSF